MPAKKAHAKSLVFLITAGPTIEDIDPVRFISNRATGKLGVEMAGAAIKARQHTILIHGPLSEIAQSRMPAGKKFYQIAVRSAAQMHAAVVENFCVADVIIMNAAVADFTPISISEIKLKKKTTKQLVMKLKPTVDILAELGATKTNPWRAGQTIIGFALESGSGKTAAQRNKTAHDEAMRKLTDKNLDAIVLDSPAEMGSDHGSFKVFMRDGRPILMNNVSKKEFAATLIKLATEMHASKI